MTYDFDEDLVAKAREIAPEGSMNVTFRICDYGENQWKFTSCRPGLEGWGDSPNEAMQRFIDHAYSKKTKAKMGEFWQNDYSREKFEALNKFMENYPNDA